MKIYVDDEAELSMRGLVQHYTILSQKEKDPMIFNLLYGLEYHQAVIFVNSASTAALLNTFLLESKFSSICIHSEMAQEEMLTNYKEFKEMRKRILVASDMGDRGIDIEHANIVINYDMPDGADTYLRRVGSAGCFGTKGLSIMFVASTSDFKILNQVQEKFEVDISELPKRIDASTYMPSQPFASEMIGAFSTPMKIYIDDEAKLSMRGLVQHYIRLNQNEKNRTIIDLLDSLVFDQAVIFVNCASTAAQLNSFLQECNFPSVCVHSEMAQEEMSTNYKKFKERCKRILVASDMGGRGIDIEHANIVINYDMPDGDDTYLRRVGSAGCFGTKGLSIMFVASASDFTILNQVQERFEVDISELLGRIDAYSYMPFLPFAYSRIDASSMA